jgi:hypothetical protein
VQAYSFTSAPIAAALVAAKKRGVTVEAILDKSQKTANYSEADFLARAGVPTFIDAKHAIAHNKIVGSDHPNARPGVEIGFKSAESEQFVDDLTAGLRAAGIDGFTVARDSRKRAIGFRSQFIPEISARWSDSRATLLTSEGVDARAREWAEESRAALGSLHTDAKTRLSYEQESYFDTRVFGREEYATASRAWGETSLEAELGRRKQALAQPSR